MFHPRPVRKPTLSKSIKDISLLTSILMGWVLGQFFSDQVRLKNASPQTCQEANPIETYKGREAPHIYLNGVGVGPVFFQNRSGPKMFHPRLVRKPALSKLVKDIRLLTSILMGWVLGKLFFQNRSGPKMFRPRPVRKPTLSKFTGDISLLTSILMGECLPDFLQIRSGPKMFHPRPVRKPTPSKLIRDIKLLTCILRG